jgi:endonuclease/exonuclease/phosphatase family metal-dependent hydrolase
MIPDIKNKKRCIIFNIGHKNMILTSMKTFSICHRCLCCIVAVLALVSCSRENNGDGNDDGSDIHETDLQKYPGKGEIKIMSFNVRCSTSKETNPYNGWDFRKDACLEMIRDQKPSLIGFQEAVFDTQWSFFKDSLAKNYEGFGVGRNDGMEKGECMGILFRKSDIKKIDGGTFWLSETPDKPSRADSWGAGNYRSATWGIFEDIATGNKFCYINTHLDLVSSARTKEMELISERFSMYNPDNYPQFLSADFNTTQNDKIFDYIEPGMLNSRDEAPEDKTDENTTYNGWGDAGGKIIDDIFGSAKVTVNEYHTVYESYGDAAYLSDHYPIYAIFKFNK